MLYRVQLSNASEPGPHRCDRGKAQKPAVNEDHHIGPRMSKKPNPVLQGLRCLFAGGHRYVLIGLKPLAKDVVRDTEYGKLDSRLVNPADQFNKMPFRTAILLGFGDE